MYKHKISYLITFFFAKDDKIINLSTNIDKIFMSNYDIIWKVSSDVIKFA